MWFHTERTFNINHEVGWWRIYQLGVCEIKGWKRYLSPDEIQYNYIKLFKFINLYISECSQHTLVHKSTLVYSLSLLTIELNLSKIACYKGFSFELGGLVCYCVVASWTIFLKKANFEAQCLNIQLFDRESIV